MKLLFLGLAYAKTASTQSNENWESESIKIRPANLVTYFVRHVQVQSTQQRQGCWVGAHNLGPMEMAFTAGGPLSAYLHSDKNIGFQSCHRDSLPKMYTTWT